MSSFVTTGAQTWRGECETGKQQSPIDFTQKNTIVQNSLSRLRFNKKYSEVQDNFMIKNNGHTSMIYVVSKNYKMQQVIKFTTS